ncbi:MAG: ThiF family adenylyltransferase [Thermodesulfobacteriota bacterium]
MRLDERLNRQLGIEGWDQSILSEARIGVVGDDDRLASLFILSASALGIDQVVVIAPALDEPLLDMARKINPWFRLIFLEGYYTHPLLGDILQGCKVIADLSRYGLANKLLLERGRKASLPIIRGFCFEEEDIAGFKIFTYLRGREWQELEEVVSSVNLPSSHPDDAVLDIICAAIVLEETKNILMGRKASADVFSYYRKKLAPVRNDMAIGVVGAGALGNFVGLGLAYSGFQDITFIDPDAIEISNLNRQVFFYDALGLNKAEILAQRLSSQFGLRARSSVSYVRSDTDLSPFEIIFDCVDNYETKIVLSETCEKQKKILISGGTSVDKGQVVVFDPGRNQAAPAALLGLYEIVDRRRLETYQRPKESCIYQPDPSIIMTNQIIAGFMVDSLNRLLAGQDPVNIFYEADSLQKI